MENPSTDEATLHDLALVYIALAHSTDQQLSDEEIEAIADRLRGWQNVKSETVLSAFKEAMGAYTQEDAQDRVNEAVRKIRDAFPKDLRQFLLDDLMDIAMADDRFLHQEGSFIGEVAQAWDVHASEVASSSASSWSILTQKDQRGNWTALHDLGLIYVTLAHSTDDDLDTKEIEAIAEKLNEWMPDASEDEVLNLVQEVLSVYAQGHDDRIFAEAVASVKESVPSHQRAALLSDLNHVAQADGQLLDEEQALIDRLSQAWEVALKA